MRRQDTEEEGGVRVMPEGLVMGNGGELHLYQRLVVVMSGQQDCHPTGLETMAMGHVVLWLLPLLWLGALVRGYAKGEWRRLWAKRYV